MSTDRRGYVCPRPGKWYGIWYYDAEGKRRFFNPHTKNKAEAESKLVLIRRAVADGSWKDPNGGGDRPTGLFADDWEQWLGTRKNVLSIDIDRRDGRDHILPFFGRRRTHEITTNDVREFIDLMRTKQTIHGEPYSENTIRGVTGRLTTFFKRAERDSSRIYQVRSPIAGLEDHERPRAPTRSELEDYHIVYSVEEIEQLISDPIIPLERRVFYALQFYTGTRFGEAAGFRWLNWNHRLDVLEIKTQYNGRPLKGKRGRPGAPRVAPVHPELRRILEEWKREGFPATFKRAPTLDDWIVPGPKGTWRKLRTGEERFKFDLEAIEYHEPTERTHSLRRSMKSIACEHDANELWIERVIHNAEGDVASLYVKNSIRAMRKAIECIPVVRRLIRRRAA